MIIIGITGTNGSGKGTVVDYLVSKKKFTHFSVTGLLNSEIQKRNLPVNRESQTLVANDLRRTHHSAYLAETLYNLAKISGNNCVIESLRTLGEIEFLRKNGQFTLLAIDADPDIRYRRILTRKSEKDNVSYDEFLAAENREKSNSDPAKQNLAACISQADFLITNNSGFSDLYRQIDAALSDSGSL